jgi:hypothetical protein
VFFAYQKCNLPQTAQPANPSAITNKCRTNDEIFVSQGYTNVAQDQTNSYNVISIASSFSCIFLFKINSLIFLELKELMEKGKKLAAKVPFNPKQQRINGIRSTIR